MRFAQSNPGLDRILVVDWDLHHGNGTQHCFEDDHRCFFFRFTSRLPTPAAENSVKSEGVAARGAQSIFRCAPDAGTVNMWPFLKRF